MPCHDLICHSCADLARTAGCDSSATSALPRTVHKETWVIGLREVVRTSTAKGWGVRKEGKYVRLEVRGIGSICLPFLWERGSVGAIHKRVSNIYALVGAGHTLKDAAERADTASASSSTDWWALLGGFRQRIQTLGNQVSDKTWNNNYEPFLDKAVRLLDGPRPPEDAFRLCEIAMKPWQGKAESRHKGINAITKFLAFAVESAGVASVSWTLQREQKAELKGKGSAPRKKAVLSDVEMLELLEDIPSEQWKNALKLLMTYGLRREELRHLEPRKHPKHGVQMFCTYRKACGNHRTEPRWLLPLQPSKAEWGDLAEAIDSGALELPVLNTDTALNTYLHRLPAWNHFKKQCEKRDEWLRPYVFRDSYSYRAHTHGLNSNVICKAMGHSLSVHQRHYVWATEDTVFDALEA